MPHSQHQQYGPGPWQFAPRSGSLRHTSRIRPARCMASLSLAIGLSAAQVFGAHAQTLSDFSTDQQRRNQERESQQRQQNEPQPDVRLPAPAPTAAARLASDEHPCFVIRLIQLDGPERNSFDWLLEHADGRDRLHRSDPPQGQCLGAQGVQQVVDRLQDALIARGYTTSRVLAGPQNLQTGTLALTLIQGRVGHIRWASDTPPRASRWNTVPTSTGNIFNLRDVEQALENYKRVPSAEADIQITPGTEPGTSDLVIAHQQPMPFRLSATADDSGTRSTGKYQGSLTLNYDNWWTLSDLFYITLLHDGDVPGCGVSF